MKKNFPVTQVEKPFPEKFRLVSKTNLKGIITYANDAFVSMSGFSSEELLGKNHNIVRHPDMPPQAFQWLWDTIREGYPWRGIVKNRCKNGDYYWVKALVVPIREHDAISGYMSVREEPTREEIRAAEAYYAQLNATGARIGSRFDKYRFRNLQIKTKLQILIQGTLLVVLMGAQSWMSMHFEEKTVSSAQDRAKQIANEIIDSANLLMESGTISDVANRKLLIEKIESSGHIRSARLVRAPQVVKQFGPGLPEEHIQDEIEKNAIETKQPYYALIRDEHGTPIFRAVTPYIVSHNFHHTDCLKCHQVEVGSVNGASDVSIDLSTDFAEFRNIQMKLIAGQILLQIFLFVFIGRCVTVFVKKPIDHAMDQFESIIRGNLDSDIDISGRDETGQLFCKLQTMQAHIQVMIDEMALAAARIEERCTSLNSQIIQVAGHSMEQQNHVQRISGNIAGFTRSVAEVARASHDSADAAVATLKIISENNTRMEQSRETTAHVVDAVRSSGHTILELKDEIEKIGRITKVIKEIADQTNLLALNAAIEAARAGEQGRGFAVVADEVRKLAERTTSSTIDITGMVGKIHDVTQTAVEAMDQAVSEVGISIELSHANTEGLHQIMQASEQVTAGAQHIADSAEAQSATSDQVSRDLDHISTLVEHNSRLAEEAKQASLELTRTAADLQAMIRHFEAKHG
ncbi:MAG: methyl-accepting chemotaxis protein [Burkholderiales bacterium]|nr:methyl-accepting chemotaxis protein [Burkholderiales bacterium]